MSKTAIITGATSGIGAEYARQLASQGYNLVITGRRQEIIQKLADGLMDKYKIHVDVILAELSEPSEVQKLIDFIDSKNDIEILINNAGFGLNKYFTRSDIDSLIRMNDTHTNATIKIIYAVIPKMINQNHGSIINVASVGGILPLARDIVYSGSKAFLIRFSEALFMEVMKKNIKYLALCPGFTHTDLHGRFDMSEKDKKQLSKFKWMSPEEVVTYSLKCIKKNTVVCIPGFQNRLMVKFAQHLPKSLYYKIVTS